MDWSVVRETTSGSVRVLVRITAKNDTNKVKYAPTDISIQSTSSI